MEKKKIIVSEGNRPLWQTIVASVFFTLAIVLLVMFFFGYEIFLQDGISSKGDFRTIFLAMACISQGILFSAVQHIFFDLNLMKYKKQYQVGFIKVGKWSKLPDIEYVSVFRQLKKNGNFIYETNLWYRRNQHFNVYETVDVKAAFAMGKSIAKVLKVDLWDATEPNNNKWVTSEEIDL